ncbi:hypothetical protein L218DRAFT_850082, partial [Marasmius fiardii PR-910]
TTTGSNSSTIPTKSTSVPISTKASDSTTQNSTTLIRSVIATGFASNGQDRPLSSNQVASLTSTNNFINYCLTISKPLMNGQQLGAGLCNPIPVGVIPSQSVMPSLKFVSPKHGAVLQPNTPFSIKLNYNNLVLSMADPQTRYLSAPQQLDPSTGNIRGYARVVIEALTSISQTTPTDPQKVALAAGMIALEEDTGFLITNATRGLPAGFYRMSSFAVTENHYPVAVPILQHGTVNDAVYVSFDSVFLLLSNISLVAVRCSLLLVMVEGGRQLRIRSLRIGRVRRPHPTQRL